MAPVYSLSKLDIPTFSGKYNDWENFSDLFRTLVYARAGIPIAEKIHILRFHVMGKALALIKHFPLNEDSYGLAWKTPKDYYENKRRIVQSQLSDLYAVKPMKAALADAISQLMNGIFTPLDALKSIQRDSERGDDMVVFMITSRFDDNTLQQWHIFLGDSTEPPTSEQARKFMERQLAIFESMEVRTKTQANSQSAKKSLPSSSHNTSQPSQPSQPTAKRKRKCIFCSADHSFFKCDVLKSKENMDRVDFEKSKGRCPNCFGEHVLTACISQ